MIFSPNWQLGAITEMFTCTIHRGNGRDYSGWDNIFFHYELTGYFSCSAYENNCNIKWQCIQASCTLSLGTPWWYCFWINTNTLLCTHPVRHLHHELETSSVWLILVVEGLTGVEMARSPNRPETEVLPTPPTRLHHLKITASEMFYQIQTRYRWKTMRSYQI